MSFEKPKTPEEIAQLMKERESSDEELRSEGGRKKGERLEITEDQFEAAKQEMDEDLQNKEKGKPESHEEKKEKVHAQITKLEETLGQPLSEESKRMIHKNELEGTEEGETDNSSKAEPKEDHRLKQEAKELGNKQQGKEMSASAMKEKFRSGEFVDSVKKLAHTLRERETNGFNPLIDPKAIPYLVSGAADLESAIANKKSSLEDINRSIKKIGGAIKAIGEVPRQMRVKDHPESLRRSGSALREIDEASKNMRLRIGGLEDPNTKETLHYFRSLENLAMDKWNIIARKRQTLEGR